MQSLRTALNDLAHSFVESVLSAIRTASVDDLVSQVTSANGARPAGRRTAPSARSAAAGRARTTASGRLPRRSADEIEEVLNKVVGLVKKKKDGLRAEEIRVEMGLQAKELPRILKQGLASKKLKSKGQKRATTYFAS